MGGLRRVPVDGGDERDVLLSVTFYNFAVREYGIYFLPRPDSQGRSAIHFLNFATGQARSVVDVGETAKGLSISPDGHSLLYSQIDERRSDLMLVGNFR